MRARHPAAVPMRRACSKAGPCRTPICKALGILPFVVARSGEALASKVPCSGQSGRAAEQESSAAGCAPSHKQCYCCRRLTAVAVNAQPQALAAHIVGQCLDACRQAGAKPAGQVVPPACATRSSSSSSGAPEEKRSRSPCSLPSPVRSTSLQPSSSTRNLRSKVGRALSCDGCESPVGIMQGCWRRRLVAAAAGRHSMATHTCSRHPAAPAPLSGQRRRG